MYLKTSDMSKDFDDDSEDFGEEKITLETCIFAFDLNICRKMYEKFLTKFFDCDLWEEMQLTL